MTTTLNSVSLTRLQGNFSGPRYSDPSLGYAVGVTTDAPSASKLRYPDDFHHIIEMPKRIMQVMNGIDRRSGQRFEDALRGIVDSTRPVNPASAPLPSK